MRQSGLTYVEVLIATVIIVVALVPALEALHTGMLGTQIYTSSSTGHYAATAKMEELLAEQYSALVLAAAAAGDQLTPSSYSDAPATPNRRLVFLGLYDADNADGDNDLFTVLDPNLDGDNNPFTGFTGLVWIRVEVEGSAVALESLSAL
jgi:hypothetical protein